MKEFNQFPSGAKTTNLGVVSYDPGSWSKFVRILWDDGSCQYAAKENVSAIVHRVLTSLVLKTQTIFEGDAKARVRAAKRTAKTTRRKSVLAKKNSK